MKEGVQEEEEEMEEKEEGDEEIGEPSLPKHMNLEFVHRWHLLAAYGTCVRHDGVV